MLLSFGFLDARIPVALIPYLFCQVLSTPVVPGGATWTRRQLEIPMPDTTSLSQRKAGGTGSSRLAAVLPMGPGCPSMSHQGLVTDLALRRDRPRTRM